MAGPVTSCDGEPASPSGTMSPAGVADFELADVLRPDAEGGVGLNVDLPVAAEAGEVVDVGRAEVDLQRV